MTQVIGLKSTYEKTPHSSQIGKWLFKVIWGVKPHSRNNSVNSLNFGKISLKPILRFDYGFLLSNLYREVMPVVGGNNTQIDFAFTQSQMQIC
jgi:hypothetical protein